MKVIVIGYTSSGKTYFLSTLQRASERMASNFILQREHFLKEDRLYLNDQIIAGKRDGLHIPSDRDISIDKMNLLRGNNVVEHIEIVDIEGQALEPSNESSGVSGKIIEEITQCDAVFFVIKTPLNNYEVEQRISQLSQMLNFVRERIRNGKSDISFVLLLSRIDEHQELNGITNGIKNLKTKLERQAVKNGINEEDEYTIQQFVESRMGEEKKYACIASS